MKKTEDFSLVILDIIIPNIGRAYIKLKTYN